jgi:TolB protein
LIGLFLAGCTSPVTQRAILTTRTPAPTPTPNPRITLIPSLTDAPKPGERPASPTSAATASSSPSPTPAPFPWLLAYDSDIAGDDEIYLLSADGQSTVNLTQHPAQDRYPAWSPDGNHVAFQSNRDGNWEIYTLDLRDERLTRLTFDLAYDGMPAWSPDGAWIAFTSFRDSTPCQLSTPVPDPPPCPDLEIYRIPAGGGTPQRLTYSPQGDYEPAWSPDGNWIAFTSWRDGDKEIYVMAASGGVARNVSADAESAADDWSPAWSPDSQALVFLSERSGGAELYHQLLDGSPPTRLTGSALPQERPTYSSNGSLLFARYDPGPAFETHDPYRTGAHHLYWLSPDGESSRPLFLMTKARRPAIAPLADLRAVRPGSRHVVEVQEGGGKAQARELATNSPPQLELRQLQDVQAPDPRLVAGVDEAFQAWRAAVHTHSGYDFLGRISDALRPAKYYSHRLGYLSWHKTGRAVDLLFDWRDDEGKNALYVVREDLAGEVYWRLFLKCAVQDGSLGEPLTQAPWYFWWHTASPGHPEEVANGGRRLPVPAGYFVDITTLAERYGWSRIASYHLDDFHWQHDSTATEYWHYQHTDGLTWYQAMAQVYSQELLEELFSRAVAAAREQSQEVMDSKGLP